MPCKADPWLDVCEERDDAKSNPGGNLTGSVVQVCIPTIAVEASGLQWIDSGTPFADNEGDNKSGHDGTSDGGKVSSKDGGNSGFNSDGADANCDVSSTGAKDGVSCAVSGNKAGTYGGGVGGPDTQCKRDSMGGNTAGGDRGEQPDAHKSVTEEAPETIRCMASAGT